MERSKVYDLHPNIIYRLINKFRTKTDAARHLGVFYDAFNNAIRDKADHILIPVPPGLSSQKRLEIYDWVIEGLQQAGDRMELFNIDNADEWWDE